MRFRPHCSSLFFRELACYLFALIPLFVVIVSRGGPLVFLLIFLCLMIADRERLTVGSFVSGCRGMLSSTGGVIATLIILWCLASAAWSIRPVHSLAKWGEVVLLTICLTYDVYNLPEKLRPRHLLCLAATIILACFFLISEFNTDLALSRLMHSRTQPAMFNRSILILLFLSIPFFLNARKGALLLPVSGRRKFYLLVAVLTLGLGLVGCFTEGDASLLAAAVAVCALLLVVSAPRFASVCMILTVSVVIVLAPISGMITDRVFTNATYEALERAHAKERVDIWKVFGSVIYLRPLAGAGFNSSRFALADQKVRSLHFSPAERRAFQSIHPHNGALQIWYELGCIGAVLTLALCINTILRISKLSASSYRQYYVYFATVFAVSVIAHGIWQSWWLAAIASGIVVLRAFAVLENGLGESSTSSQ
ncbi:MAG: O-antigen ligase family protein [Methylobacteriaceae bacterium]|jgi:O-antigen ligase|nr:O-antigen ligase family protein [Methylobacteriaceae bacterium]